jgi:hypothetical protein
MTVERGSVRREVRIACPAEQVWAMVGDPARITVAVDDPQALAPDLTVGVADTARQDYVTGPARNRLHQPQPAAARRQRVPVAGHAPQPKMSTMRLKRVV